MTSKSVKKNHKFYDWGSIYENINILQGVCTYLWKVVYSKKKKVMNIPFWNLVQITEKESTSKPYKTRF